MLLDSPTVNVTARPGSGLLSAARDSSDGIKAMMTPASSKGELANRAKAEGEPIRPRDERTGRKLSFE
jgi:hypothetical protein